MKILTDIQEQDMAVSPIEQTKKHTDLSDKYKVIETSKVMQVFQDNGLDIVGKSIAGTRKESRQGFQTHMVVFSADHLQTNEGRMQLLLTNSHDGSSSFQLDLGFFRMACANGLIDGSTESCLRVRHTGNCLNRLDKAVQYQLERLPYIAAKIDNMRQIKLDNGQIMALLHDAADLRVKELQRVFGIPPTRQADISNDLWTVFNRIQEKVIRGGLEYMNRDGQVKRTRKVTSIQTVTKLNKDLWNLADQYSMVA